jgi:hypothetical protein
MLQEIAKYTLAGWFVQLGFNKSLMMAPGCRNIQFVYVKWFVLGSALVR